MVAIETKLVIKHNFKDGQFLAFVKTKEEYEANVNDICDKFEEIFNESIQPVKIIKIPTLTISDSKTLMGDLIFDISHPYVLISHLEMEEHQDTLYEFFGRCYFLNEKYIEINCGTVSSFLRLTKKIRYE